MVGLIPTGLTGGLVIYPKQIAHSCRFNDDDTAFLSRTPSTDANGGRWTFSTWVERGNLGIAEYVFSDGATSFTTGVRFTTGDNLIVDVCNQLNTAFTITSSAVFRDPSAWYHLHASVNTSAAEADRVIISVNGIRQAVTGTMPTLGFGSGFSDNFPWRIGSHSSGQGIHFDGYMAETIFVDGSDIAPSNFGQLNSYGVWVAKNYIGPYGTHGFKLQYGSGGALGIDTSGNGNDFTPSGLASNDQLPDSPTHNYPTWHPLSLDGSGTVTYSNGNLRVVTADSSGFTGRLLTTMEMPHSGKWYFEQTIAEAGTSSSGSGGWGHGIYTFENGAAGTPGYFLEYFYRRGVINDAVIRSEGGNLDTGLSFATNGDIVGLEIDADNNTYEFFLNGSSVGSGSYTLDADRTYFIGHRPDTGATGRSTTTELNCGQHAFDRTPTTGFVELNSADLPTPPIKVPSKYFSATLYTGNGSVRSIAIDGGFQPSLAWIKNRDQADGHALHDDVRGSTIYVASSSSGAESTNANSVTAFNFNGFSLGTGANGWNDNTEDFVSWCWKGQLIMDVVTYTGTGSTNAVAHNLGSVPGMMWIKNRGATAGWAYYHKGVGNTSAGLWNNTAIGFNSSTTWWNNTSPTATHFTVESNLGVNDIADNYVAYLFAEMEGFSKFGLYTGNGNANGPFIYTGFRPAWIMHKRSNSSGTFPIQDSKRNPFNVANTSLYANSTAADASGDSVDLLSNGFKVRVADGNVNVSTGIYAYAAFAETPFKYAGAR